MTLFGSQHWQRSIRCQCCSNRTIVGLPAGESLRAATAAGCLRRASAGVGKFFLGGEQLWVCRDLVFVNLRLRH
jgi:hypothetical protein